MQAMYRRYTLSAILGLLLVLLSGSAMAQYQVRYLDADVAGKATHLEPLLGDPWGLVYAPGGPFWISDESTGWSTLYNGSGIQQSLEVVVPTANGTGFGTPTGIVFNGSQEFAIDSWVSVFIYDTLDGSIQGWSGFNPNATLVAATSSGASYTGLAITSKTSGNTLFAADSANNRVDMYDGNFNLIGSFTDKTLPAGFAPFGIQDIGGQVYVTFAATNGGAGGYIDIFTESGAFVKRVTSNGPLNQPWGLAVAPSDFGTLSGTLLVSNNTSTGTIVGYNLTTGKLVGTVKDTSGKDIKIDGLWGIEFGGGSANNGAKNQLFFTAGPNDYYGYFGWVGVAK
ncbi:MAG: TIGR03118 family protein [Candidatus Sulfotelmatobacter sp.]